MHFYIINILVNHGFSKTNNSEGIYISLYEALKNAIINKSLAQNLKLPPSRILAKDLNISRSTVIKAYDLLLNEKYIKSVTGSGYYVLPHKTSHILHNEDPQNGYGLYPKISKRGAAFKNNNHLISHNNVGIAFRPGLPPLDVFPVQQWKNLTNNYWSTIKSSQLSYSSTIGLQCLRENIANYLKIYRNINCNPNQVFITTGSLHSLYLISNALIDKGDEVIMENPTYPRAYSLFKSLKAKIIAANIDNEGIVVNALKCKAPKLIYTTPSNQYPLGVKMSLARRLELLKWASSHGALILEDDYDHEFSNWEGPVSSIYSLDRQARVIYLGTFNKLLHPSIRIGYMIVPRFLINTITALYEHSNRFVSPSVQQILSSFIEKDYLNKHLRRVLEISIERKKIFEEHFNACFENEITLDSINNGLHIIGRIEKETNDKLLANYLAQKGIIAHPFSNYFIKGKRENGLVMGYCSVNTKLIKDNVYKMNTFYNSFMEH